MVNLTKKSVTGLDSRNSALESPKNQSLTQEIITKTPAILQGAFSKKNTAVLTETGKFIFLPFLNWKFLKLVLALIALYVLIQHDTQAQAYQQYPISPPLPSQSTAPKYSPEDSAIIKNYSQQIITHNPISQRGNVVVCDLFMKGSRITSISKVGSYYKLKAQFRDYTYLYFFKASKYNLSWIRSGMLTDATKSRKQYAKAIQANKERIAVHNKAVRDSIANENRSFISRVINPDE